MNRKPESSIEIPGGSIPPRPWMPTLVALLAGVLALLAGVGFYLTVRPLPFNPTVWQSSLGSTRGRMLKSLLSQTDFLAFPRSEVEVYLGAADFDDRTLWYDLGPAGDNSPVDPRADMGNPNDLYGVFAYDQAGVIKEVLYNHRRPTLGSQPYDSATWASAAPAGRRAMFTSALGKLRGLGMTRAAVLELLGPPAGERVRSQYDIGRGGSIFGGQKALILEYNPGDTVISSRVTP